MMPLLKIQTNETLNAVQQEQVLAKLSAVTAEMLGKPERYVMVIVESAVAMRFAADSAPTIYAELKSIGLPENRTSDFSTTLCTALTELTGVAAERIYIEFSSAERHLWGWNGATF
jgi:phenylpyruvate tautomerase PptA (4-oxalocrotonate tautomerase family)